MLGAWALRGPQLDLRPFHGDEAVHAIKFQGLWEKGVYRYDPHEYHGPVLYYATLPVVWMLGVRNLRDFNEGTFRTVVVLFGLGLVGLVFGLRDGWGRGATLAAALFTAVSPAMVFYSRYYIHEMLLVFFTLLVMVGAWRFARSGRGGWLVLAGAGVGLMQSAKETFVVPLGCLALAAGLTSVWTRWMDRRWLRWPVGESCGPWLGAVAAALGVWLILFSSFFTNLAGMGDSIRTYLPWLERAGGASPHIHPWFYYLKLLTWFHVARGPVWSEGLILGLAGVGAVAALAGKGLGDTHPGLARWLTFYTVLVTGAYALIPYKTPWCLLGFWHGMILLAGLGTAVWFRWAWSVSPCPVYGWGRRVGLTLIFALATGHLTWQAVAASYTYCTDRGNPYVYAHPVPDMRRLVRQIETLALVSPQHYQLLCKVMAKEGDYWPLPWYFRQFSQVGWYDRVPEDPKAAVILVSPAFEGPLEAKLGPGYIMAGGFSLRPYCFFELFISLDLWREYLRTRPPILDDDE